MCDCIKEAEECIKDELGAAFVQWERFGTQASEVRIVYYRKDGARSKVSRYTRVPWRYCPLCGEELSEE